MKFSATGPRVPQTAIDHRQSCRVSRDFLVTGYEDPDFCESFQGHDVNLTGVSFWVNDIDLFLPQQPISLRIRNAANGEEYFLDSVEVVHLKAIGDRFLCGCHINAMTSSQLLSHNRLVIAHSDDEDLTQLCSEMDEFNFLEVGSGISSDSSVLQEAVLALDLAIAQLHQLRLENKQKSRRIKDLLDSCMSVQGPPEFHLALENLFSSGSTALDNAAALAILAKLLAHSPNDSEDRADWNTILTDFEKRFVIEKYQQAYDLMHQGYSVDEALQAVNGALNKE